MTSPHDAPSLAPPFSLDRDLLGRNLEVKRAERFPCPHCSQTMEWNLGPKTKGAIIEALAQGNLHEAFLFCDKDNCPSVQRDGNESLVNPFVRRISAQDDGTIIIKTFPLDGLLRDVAHFRQLSKVATRKEVARETAHRSEIDDLRRDFEVRLAVVTLRETASLDASIASETRRADEASATLVAKNGELKRAQVKNAGLITEMEEKGRQLSAARQEIEHFARAAAQLAEICRLGNITPVNLLERAKTWAAKQQGGRK